MKICSKYGGPGGIDIVYNMSPCTNTKFSGPEGCVTISVLKVGFKFKNRAPSFILSLLLVWDKTLS